MKVYWSSRLGCVICSANASGQGLGGDGSQKEAGVYLPPNAVDIQRLWDYAKPKPIRGGDLKRLTRDSERASKQNNNVSCSEEPAADFLEWQSFSGRRDWKLGWWEGDIPFAKNAVKTAKQRFGVTEPDNMLSAKKAQLNRTDWALMFKLPGGTAVRWLYVDFVIRVDRSDEDAFAGSYIAPQVITATQRIGRHWE